MCVYVCGTNLSSPILFVQALEITLLLLLLVLLLILLLLLDKEGKIYKSPLDREPSPLAPSNSLSGKFISISTINVAASSYRYFYH